MNRTTLCYIECGGKLLMMQRNKKKDDENAGKYVGLGGHFEEGETPEACVLREVREEAGITLEDYAYRGIVHFSSNEFGDEEMHLFTAHAEVGKLPVCDEGTLCLITKEKLFSLPRWEGDRIFLDLLFGGAPFFDLSLRYEGETLKEAVLNGKQLEI